MPLAHACSVHPVAPHLQALLLPFPRRGTAPTQSRPIPRDGLLLGRGEVVFDEPFDDPAMSPRHAELRFRGAEAVVVDLGSTTGTRLNGAAVREPSALTVGDVLRLGDTTLMYTTMDRVRRCSSTPGRSTFADSRTSSASRPSPPRPIVRSSSGRRSPRRWRTTASSPPTCARRSPRPSSSTAPRSRSSCGASAAGWRRSPATSRSRGPSCTGCSGRRSSTRPGSASPRGTSARGVSVLVRSSRLGARRSGEEGRECDERDGGSVLPAAHVGLLPPAGDGRPEGRRSSWGSAPRPEGSRRSSSSSPPFPRRAASPS